MPSVSIGNGTVARILVDTVGRSSTIIKDAGEPEMGHEAGQLGDPALVRRPSPPGQRPRSPGAGQGAKQMRQSVRLAEFGPRQIGGQAPSGLAR